MIAHYPWHQSLINHVEQQQNENLLAPAMLFRCRKNYFDEVIGWELAKLILCDTKGGSDDCKHCHLTTEERHPNVMFFDVFNEKIGIDDVRQLEQKVWQTSVFDKPKVAFINGVDLLSIAAQNALLKTLEEPPKNVFFVLSAENTSRVLVTIISRVQRLKHVKLQYDDLLHWLQIQMGNDAKTKAEIITITKLSGNQPKSALALLFSPESVAHINGEKQLFVRFLSGKLSAKELLNGFDYKNPEDVLYRFCQYTEGMIRFLFEKSLQLTDNTSEKQLQCMVWNRLSLRDFYHLRDVLIQHQHLSHTNVNMTMQLTTSLSGWQNDRKSDKKR